MDTNKHTFFGGLMDDEYENRLLNQVDPPKLPGSLGDDASEGKYPEQKERIGAVYEDIDTVANDVAMGNREYEALMKDDEWRRYFFARIDYDFGRGGVRLLQKEQIDIRDIGASKGSEKHLLDFKGQAETDVANYIAALKQYQEELRAAIAVARANGDATDLMVSALTAIEQISATQEVLGKRQGVILEIADKIAIIALGEFSVAEAKSRIAEISPVPGTEEGNLVDVGKLQEEIDQALEDIGDKLRPENVGKIFDVLNEAAALPPPEMSAEHMAAGYDASGDFKDRITIRLGLRDAQLQLVKVEQQQKHHLLDRFPERLRFYYLLNGGDPKDLIAKCKREDGMLDFEMMQMILEHLADEGVSAKIAEDLRKELKFDAVLDDEVDTIIKDYGLSTEGDLGKNMVKQIANKILREGKFSYNISDLEENSENFDSVDQFYQFIRLMFGAEVEVEMMEKVNLEGLMDAEGKEGIKAYVDYLKKYKQHLVIQDSAAEDFVSVWDSKEFEDYLRDTVEYNNTPFADTGRALQRAFLPENVSTYLDEQNIDIDVGDLRKLVHSDKVKAYKDTDMTFAELPDLIDRAVGIVINPETGEVNQRKALNIFSFLLSEEGDSRGDAQKRVEKIMKGIIEEARKGSHAYFNIQGEKIFVKGESVAERKKVIEDIKLKFTSVLGLGLVTGVDKHVIDHLKTLNTSKLNDDKVGMLEKVSLSTSEFGGLVVHGAKAWWDRMVSLKKNFVDAGDRDLGKLSQRGESLINFNNQLETMLGDFGKHKNNMTSLFNERLKQHTEEYDAAQAGVEFINLPNNSKKLRAAMEVYMARTNRIRNVLMPLLVSKDVHTRRTAFFLATQPKTADNPDPLARAIKYIDDSSSVTLNGHEIGVRSQFVVGIKNTEAIEGKDILVLLRNALNVGVFEKGIDILDGKTDADGNNLLSKKYHFDHWLIDPSNAEPGLRAVLYDLDNSIKIDDSSGGGKEALIQAFCNKKSVKLKDRSKLLTFSEAESYVRAIQSHLLRVQRDASQSRLQAARKERFKDPIDVLRSGVDSIANLWNSGDRVKQGVAAAIVISAGVVLWKGLKSKKWQKFVVGIPLLFGADIVIKDMTGKGVFQRLSLTYMNEKDRNSAFEQFIRRNEKRKGYEDIGSTAGYEATRQLMNPDNPVPVNTLLDWRSKVRGRGFNGKYGDVAPPQVQAIVRKVSGKLSGFDKRDYSRAEREERAYALMLNVFEALCLDIAVGDPAVSNSVEKGMDVIRGRYVDFDAKHLQAVEGLSELMSEVAAKRPGGGFSMLDVLVYERPTPAMEHEVFENESMLEWSLRGSSMTAKEFLAWIKREGISPFKGLVRHAKEKSPEMYRKGKELVSENFDSFMKYAKRFSKKWGMEINEEVRETLKGLYNMISTAGLVIYEHGPDSAEWVLKTGADLSLGLAQNIYLELDRHHITGPMLRGFDALVKRVLGANMFDLIALRNKFENNAEHVEALASVERVRGNLINQLNNVVKASKPLTTSAVNEWIVGIYNNAFSPTDNLTGSDEDKIKAFDALPAHEKMAVYELMKRRVYSFVIAQYMKKKHAGLEIKFPMETANGWPSDLSSLKAGTLEGYVDNVYGWNTLRYIGVENSISGATEDLIEKIDPGVKKTACIAATSVMRMGMYERASEYLLSQKNLFIVEFMSKAEEEFDGGNKAKKIRMYRAYLDTLMVNAIMEMTFGKIESGVADKVGGITEADLPLTLMAAQAQDYLLYLKYMRGSSATPAQISTLDLSAFFPERDDDALSEIREYVGEPDKVGERESETKTNGVEKSEGTELAKKIDAGKLKELTLEKKRSVLRTFVTGAVPLTDDLKKQFAEDADSRLLPHVNTGEIRKECMLYLCVVDGDKKEEIHDKLLEYFDGPDKIDELMQLSAYKKEVPPEVRDHVQIFLDRAVVKIMEPIAEEIKNVKDMKTLENMANAKTNDQAFRQFNTWEKQLAQLYSVTEETHTFFSKTSDLVSYILEFLMYRGAPVTYEQYKKDLAAKPSEYAARTLLPTPSNIEMYTYDYCGNFFNRNFDSVHWPPTVRRINEDKRGRYLRPKNHVDAAVSAMEELDAELEKMIDQ